jgi:hypothetical protein
VTQSPLHIAINTHVAPLLRALRMIRAKALRAQREGTKINPDWLEKATRDVLERQS